MNTLPNNIKLDMRFCDVDICVGTMGLGPVLLVQLECAVGAVKIILR